MIKLCEVINLDNIDTLIEQGHLSFFDYLNSALRTILEDTLLSSEDYDKSYLYKIIDTESQQLDLDYFIGHSSDKYLSNYFIKFMNKYNLESAIKNIGDSLAQKFGLKWYKIGQAIISNYKPLENYDMEEIRTPNLTENVTRKQATDVNVHQSTESGIYGFNSTESQPTATGDGDTHTTGIKNNNETEDVKSNTGTESLTRHGNIGVTTSQQMLESEIVLREKHNFVEMIFRDIDSVLCLKVY